MNNKIIEKTKQHWWRDVGPKTLEAKILTVADSVSHMTDINYLVHLSEKPKEWVSAKLERDYRDTGIFPELQKEIAPLCRAWRKLISVYPNKYK